jgi:hypothetical protein
MRLVFLARLFLIRLRITFRESARVDPVSSTLAHLVLSAVEVEVLRVASPTPLTGQTANSAAPGI